MSDLTVACVLRASATYTPEYVHRLRDGVLKHTACRFVCLSDVDVDCERIPLVTNWPGWLAKIELFRPGLFGGPVVYLDLDTVVRGDVSFLARPKPGFTMLSDFYKPEIPASGVMSWFGDYSRIYRHFSDGLVPEYRGLVPNRGDCGWIVKKAGPIDRIPDDGRVISYKAHVRKGGSKHAKGDGTIPAKAKVICFHGNPRPHEVSWLGSAS